MDQKTPRRRASKDFRRRQLIEATIDCIASGGLGDLTLSHVANRAGLSQGIVNLHFESKDNLLAATLTAVRDEFVENWRSAVDSASNNPADKLAALLQSDFNARVADPKKLAVWFAFWGEAKSRPTYKKICASRIADYAHTIEKLLTQLIEEEQATDISPTGKIPANISAADISAANLAESVMAMADGFWLNLLLFPSQLTRKQARKQIMDFMARSLPSHRDSFATD